MYLTGLIHRDRLFDVASRWLAGRVLPTDGRVLTEIFVFERAITAPTVRALVVDLARAVEPGPLQLERVVTKDAVREAIVAAVTSPGRRVEELIERYRSFPEEYFPRTPVFMSLVRDGNGRLVAMVRRKRIRRIAEKASRRLADRLAGVIEDAAREIAAERASRNGLLLESMVSPQEVMVEDFTEAERRVAARLRAMAVRFERDDQRLDDVIGVKMIAAPPELERIEEALSRRPGTTVLRREVHDGRYSGIHLEVELEQPPVDAVVGRMHGVDWTFAAGRGLSPWDLEGELYEYVATGSRTFRVELILTTFDDLIESEFGRSIHEARILEQRVRYSGRIAQNASYIIEYMLCLAISPTVSVADLPIKITGRYLRDTLSHAIAELRGGEVLEWVLPREDGGNHTML